MKTKFVSWLVVLLVFGEVDQCSSESGDKPEDGPEYDEPITEDGREYDAPITEPKWEDDQGGSNSTEIHEDEEVPEPSPEEKNGEPNWCNLICKDGSENIMCVGSYAVQIQYCEGFKHKMNPYLRSEILHWHNELRNKLAGGTLEINPRLPTAEYMNQLSWDEDLEVSAMMWSMMCNIHEAPCSRTEEFLIVGQNFNVVALDSDDEAGGYLACMKPWLSEGFLATTDLIDNYTLLEKNMTNEDRRIRNFLKMIHAESYRMGCALAEFSQSGVHFNMLVCNYGPGPDESFPIYDKGRPCHHCPYFNSSCRNESMYPNLCAYPDDPPGKSLPIYTSADKRMSKLLNLGPSSFTGWYSILTVYITCSIYF